VAEVSILKTLWFHMVSSLTREMRPSPQSLLMEELLVVQTKEGLAIVQMGAQKEVPSQVRREILQEGLMAVPTVGPILVEAQLPWRPRTR